MDHPHRPEVIFNPNKSLTRDVLASERGGRWNTTYDTTQRLDEFFAWFKNVDLNAHSEEDLQSMVYKQFIESPDSEKLVGNFAEHPEVIQAYSDRVEQELIETEADLRAENSDMLEVGVSGNRKSWMYVNINGGVSKEQPRGRLYINVQAEKMHELFALIAIELAEAAIVSTEPGGILHVDMKTTRRCVPLELNRRDKIIIYFNDVDAKHLVDVLTAVAEKRIELQYFSRSTMPFTQKIKPVNGLKLGAVSFAQSPNTESFAESRSKLLIKVARKMRNDKQPPQVAYNIACTERNIDPLCPAFSRGGREAMPNMTKLLDLK